MPYRHTISDKQLAPFLEAAKLMTIPEGDVPPLVVEAIPEPSASQNETILAMHQALIAETIKMNANNVKEYEERKELWYHETAIATYLAAKKKADEEEVKRKAEEAVAKKAAEEKNECAMDVNSEGEDEADKDETPKSKLRSKLTKSRLIVDSESEEETEEVKAKKRKVKGRERPRIQITLETRHLSTTQDVPEFPFARFAKAAKYQRTRGSKNHCFVCHMRSNVCSFTRDEEAEFIMPEAVDDKELQVKLRKLCDEQDAFKTQKDKEKAERSKAGKKPKAGTKKTLGVTSAQLRGLPLQVQVNVKALGSNAKASGSTPKVVSEEDNIVVEARPKRARTVANSDGSVERIPSVTESLHGINKALIVTVDLLGDTRAVNENQAKYLRGIELSMANLQSAMQTHVAQVHSYKEVKPAGPEDMEEEVEEVREEVEEVHEEVEEVREEDKEGREVEDDETMKDPEADEL
ncbi:hypothetical protein M422DRAFT_253085 [Sphaerobolus stellatus SS14]|uniref:Uncharacterized protein n=1 Tax=Sphaerobolus stellatus (strain SS14) TaxID=990650 RepID=A0A0C9VYI2_SPHS4|nr:hypothetical protein M422DRAFT_253085 [Sphaerobolus stellatus SS14]